MGSTVLLFLSVIFFEAVSVFAYLKRRQSPSEEVRQFSKFFLVPATVGFIFIIYFILVFLGVE